MTSRWAHWSRGNYEDKKGFSTFLAEAPSAAALEAQKRGLQFAGFAKYADPRTGEIVARIQNGELIDVAGPISTAGTTAATTDTGNPTNAASGISPADRANQMGLQSDGSGGYIDPQTGELAARTVNNELIFYSPQGGAISDGGGGEQLTQAAPSWVDPVTGELMVPPAQPESPEEVAAIPDSVPALAPASYNGFMNAKRKEMYAQQGAQMSAQQDIDGQQAEVEEMFQSYPMMGRLLNDMKEIIERANASGDQHKMAVATILQDTLSDIANEVNPLFDKTKEEDHEELGNLLKKREVAKAKNQHYKDSQPEGSIKASDNTAPEEYGDSEVNQRKYQDDINQILDKNTEIKSFGKAYKHPKEISSNGITYNLKPRKVIAPQMLAKKTNDALRDAGINSRVDEKLKVTEIDWEVDGTKDGLDIEGNRKELGQDESNRRAMSALKAWRREVLPQLSPGMIVNATPMADEGEGRVRNQRERIYQLAGFGDNGYQNGYMPGMYAVVIENEDGENELIPINPTDKQKNRRLSQMESIYIRFNDGILNMNEQKVVTDMLLL